MALRGLRIVAKCAPVNVSHWNKTLHACGALILNYVKFLFRGGGQLAPLPCEGLKLMLSTIRFRPVWSARKLMPTYIWPQIPHVIRNVAKGQLIRVRRICSEEKDFDRNAEQVLKIFKPRGCLDKHLQRSLKEVKNITRKELLGDNRNKRSRIVHCEFWDPGPQRKRMEDMIICKLKTIGRHGLNEQIGPYAKDMYTTWTSVLLLRHIILVELLYLMSNITLNCFFLSSF